MADILRNFNEFASFGANYVKVIKVRPVMPTKNVAQRI